MILLLGKGVEGRFNILIILMEEVRECIVYWWVNGGREVSN